jgi:hypothetical protein
VPLPSAVRRSRPPLRRDDHAVRFPHRTPARRSGETAPGFERPGRPRCSRTTTPIPTRHGVRRATHDPREPPWCRCRRRSPSAAPARRPRRSIPAPNAGSSERRDGPRGGATGWPLRHAGWIEVVAPHQSRGAATTSRLGERDSKDAWSLRQRRAASGGTRGSLAAIRGRRGSDDARTANGTRAASRSSWIARRSPWSARIGLRSNGETAPVTRAAAGPRRNPGRIGMVAPHQAAAPLPRAGSESETRKTRGRFGSGARRTAGPVDRSPRSVVGAVRTTLERRTAPGRLRGARGSLVAVRGRRGSDFARTARRPP